MEERVGVLRRTAEILRQRKFEFNAAQAAMQAVDALKRIKADSGLSEDEKIAHAMLTLFGPAPAPSAPAGGTEAA